MSEASRGAQGAGGERQVRALPVIAVAVVALTAAAVIYLGRDRAGTTASPDAVPAAARRTGEPDPARDEDHYVAGSPPAVAERFLRAWFRYRYDQARELSAGAMRQLAERRLAELHALAGPALEEYRRTRVYVDATHYDLEHVELRDLPPTPDGRARKEVRGQAHAYGAFAGTRGDSRRGQVFTLELVDGSWRVVDRTWESVPSHGADGAVPADGSHPGP